MLDFYLPDGDTGMSELTSPLMKKRTLTRSSKKHVRSEKAKIRRIADPAVRAQRTSELYAKFGINVPNKG